MRQVYPVIFTPLNDKKDTVLIEVPDWEILTEGYGMADAVKMARDAIGLKGITYEDKEKKFPEASSINEIDTCLLYTSALHIVTHPGLSELAFGISVFLFLGTLIIGDRRARLELKRRFHVR